MNNESPIVDKDGKPLQRNVLSQQIASASMTGVRQSWMTDSVANSLTPARLGSLLQSANEGNDYDYLTLAEEMEERELHYGSVLSTRKLAIQSLPIVVEAASDSEADKNIASAVEALVRRPAFRKMTRTLLDGLGKGRSTCEIMWDKSGPTWEPKKFIHRDARYFKYHPERSTELRLIDKSDLHEGLELPAYKFITHVPELKTGLPVRSGLARLVAVAYMCKSYSFRDWMSFSELFGLPIRVGKYGPTASDPDIKILRQAVANIGSDAAAVIPESMRIEFIERAGGAGSAHQLFEVLAKYLDAQISKAVLGQTASTEGTPGKLGGDDAQNEVRKDLLAADAEQLSDTVNEQLIKGYVDLNFGVQKDYPLVSFHVADPEDLAALVNALKELIPHGLKVSESQVRDKLGLRAPEGEEDVLQAAAPAAEPVALDHSQPVALNREAKPDDFEMLRDAAMGGWEQVMAPMLNPVEALVNDAQDYDEFMVRLPGLLENMDANGLVQHLGLAAFKARGEGNAAS